MRKEHAEVKKFFLKTLILAIVQPPVLVFVIVLFFQYLEHCVTGGLLQIVAIVKPHLPIEFQTNVPFLKSQCYTYYSVLHTA